MAVILITGGARSGKSRRAELRARSFPGQLVYIATAEALDAEMDERIARHRARRGNDWIEREVPLDLVATLTETDGGGVRLVDCLTLWLSNLLFAGQAAQQAEADVAIDCPLLAGASADLIAVLPTLPGSIILVSNEVGWGIVPMHPVSRLFAEEQGRLNQRVAAVCDRVTLVAAGLPLTLKAPGMASHD